MPSFTMSLAPKRFDFTEPATIKVSTVAKPSPNMMVTAMVAKNASLSSVSSPGWS